MKKIITLVIFLNMGLLFAQQKLTVTYFITTVVEDSAEYLKADTITSSENNKYWINQLTINDSVAYSCYIDKGEYTEYIPKNYNTLEPGKLGKYFLPHSNYSNFKKRVLIENFYFYNDNCYLKDTLPMIKEGWRTTGISKEIMGHKCYKADKIIDGKVEEICWFTKDYPCNLTDTGYNGLDGLILEKYNVRNKFLVTAIGVIEDANKIAYPNDGRFLTRKQMALKIKEYKNRKR